MSEGAKSTHSAKFLKGFRDRMESDMVDVLRKARIVKARLEALDTNQTLRAASYQWTLQKGARLIERECRLLME